MFKLEWQHADAEGWGGTDYYLTLWMAQMDGRRRLRNHGTPCRVVTYPEGRQIWETSPEDQKPPIEVTDDMLQNVFGGKDVKEKPPSISYKVGT